MAYKIIHTESAEQDLDNILGYMVYSLANPSAAASFADAVAACYSDLEKTPLMYELCHDPRLRTLEYHKAVIKNYIMVYKVDEPTKTVYILRFFYGRQDYERLL